MKTNSEKGLSLIEALVTIAVVGVLGLGLTTLITRTYKGGAKTQLIGDIKQNAQSSMDKITKIIRDADAVICNDAPPSPDVPYQTLAVKESAGKIIRLFIVPQTALKSGYIAKQEFNLPLDPNSTNYCSFNAVLPENSPAPAILTDNESVSVKSGSFSRSINPGSKDTITIELNIGPSYSAGSGFEESIGGEDNTFPFRTSVQLR